MNENNKKEYFFKFPCIFPIKIIANYDAETVEIIFNILKKNILNNKLYFNIKKTKNDKYIYINIIFKADNKNQLKNIYKEIAVYSKVHVIL